jgi:endonuclease/exonuclease/phosphatase family metal-dependent hydrolase
VQGTQGSYRACHVPAFYDADSAHDAILVRNGIDVAGAGAFWISSDGKTAAKPEGSLCMRHASYVRLQLASGPLLAVNAHLDHTDDPAVKRHEMELFTGLLGELSGMPPRRTIVLGDFNSVPDLPPYRLLEAFGLRDAARLQANEQPTAVHWAKQPASQRIDYIWVSEDLTRTLTDYEVIDGAYRRQDGSAGHASDHCAVLASFDI